MSTSFTANNVGILFEDFDGAYTEVLTVAFGRLEDDGTPEEYLLFQRCVEDNEDDEDGYYVEWCDQSNSKYECLELLELSRNKVKAIFDKNTDFADEITAEFEVDDEKFEEVKQKLGIIFRDRKCFSLNL